MILRSDDRVLLRDFMECDIQKRIEWETIETEWQQWDAPWEYDQLTEAQKQTNLQEYITEMHGWADQFKSMPDTRRRWGFQICVRDHAECIGWCNSYRMDDHYNYSTTGQKCTIGINIPEPSQRGKGYAFRTLCLFIDYLTECGESEFYTQTWSGNKPMIGLAAKLGFEECNRERNSRTVRGNQYDGLTFRLNRQLYEQAKRTR